MYLYLQEFCINKVLHEFGKTFIQILNTGTSKLFDISIWEMKNSRQNILQSSHKIN
jgi:hypothetical protein